MESANSENTLFFGGAGRRNAGICCFLTAVEYAVDGCRKMNERPGNAANGRGLSIVKVAGVA
jgi:hypothetical protein